MGIIGFVAKTVGTVALTGTGLASALLEHAAEMSGSEPLAELMSQGKDGSFNTIKKMWSPNAGTQEETPQQKINKQIKRKESALSSLRSKASDARRVGNEELFEQLNARVESLKEEISDLKYSLYELNNS